MAWRTGSPSHAQIAQDGKLKTPDAIKGAVMRETKGMAKADVVQQILQRELGSG